MLRISYFKRLAIIAAFGASISLTAQDRIINLYEGLPPFSTGINSAESWEDGRVSNVQIPQLYVFQADSAINTGVAVIYCPGGGYRRLAMPGNGKGYGEFFNKLGVTAIVLKYRLPVSEDLSSPHEVPIADATRAIQLVRSMAGELRIDPNKVGIMGGSAGGHLASTLSTHYKLQTTGNDSIANQSSKPDFTILMYPVISMDATIAHMGSRTNLLGKDPGENLVQYYSNDLNVNGETPITFIVHGSNDASVSVLNSMRYYDALVANDVSAEMHFFADGRHGAGMGKTGEPWAMWKDLCTAWLEKYILP